MAKEKKMEYNERKLFRIINCHKRDFRDWMKEQFPQLKKYSFPDSPAYDALQERFDEVHAAATEVFSVIMTRSDRILQDYYRQDQTALDEAYQRRDVKKYARALDSFINAINME